MVVKEITYLYQKYGTADTLRRTRQRASTMRYDVVFALAVVLGVLGARMI